MVVCKFFQQGYCRYGKNCRYDHIYGSKYTYYANPPQATQPTPAPPQAAGVTDEQLVNQVQTDVQAALRGGQWILSCYSPFKEKPTFPGIPDLSPEEARLFIYEAKNSNNLDQAVQYMNNMFKETRQKYEQLLQPNPNIVKVLRSLYKGELVASPFTSGQQTAFSNSNNTASSIFRSAAQAAPAANQNNAQSIFRQAQQTNSIFNMQTAQDPAKQLFSQANNTNVFGPSQPTIFAQNQNNQNSTAKSIFAIANQSTQVQTNPQSVFAAANQNIQSNQPNVFAVANQNVFAPQPVQTSPFSQGNVFQVAQNPTNIFGQVNNKPQTMDDPGVYSRMEELSPEDLEAFKSDHFELGFIPELPPPHELCTAAVGSF